MESLGTVTSHELSEAAGTTCDARRGMRFRRFWSMFPLTRATHFGYRFFEPLPFSKQPAGGSRCLAPDGNRRFLEP